MTLAAALAEAIGVATDTPCPTLTLRPIGGGDINRAFRASGGSRPWFVKTNRAGRLPMFEAEAAALHALAATDSVRVPRPLCSGTAAGQAFLVLEYLVLRGHGDAARLGEQLARLHRVPQARPDGAHFGWAHDNWIGSTPQPNGWRHDWVAFWREQRLGHQLKLAAQNGYGGALQRDGEVLMARLDGLFVGYRPTPSLLHGDLWGGNHGYLADGTCDPACPSGHGKPEFPCGTPVIFDPAIYVGDRECDLAMSELFGGFAPAFHAAYREAWPLDPGYAVRKTLYNLYHILNHANLFGGGYAAQAQRMLSQLLAQLR
jgi:protein-ribulosamine 3-kinase